jgi:prepilin-type N-terminal cleavage/methylation domain-containing protein
MSPVTGSLRGESGMTLAEVLVATVVIGVGLVGLAAVIPLSSYGVHEGNALSTATFLAEQRLEEVRNADWTTIPTAIDCIAIGPTAAPTTTACTRTVPTTCTSGTACTTYPDEAAVAGYADFSRRVRVIDCTADCGINDPDMRLVRVTVSYRPISGVGGSAATATKSAVLELLVARRQ